MQTPKELITTNAEAAAEVGSRWVHRKYSSVMLMGVSFVESALPVPIITDPFLVAYILARRERLWYYVTITTVSSVVGGLFAYALAFWFYDSIITPYLSAGVQAQVSDISEQLREGVFLMTFLGAFTPIPYTIVAMGAGLLHGSVATFIVASVIGRGVRYAIIGWLSYRYGQYALTIARRHILWATAGAIVLVAAFFTYKMWL